MTNIYFEYIVFIKGIHIFNSEIYCDITSLVRSMHLNDLFILFKDEPGVTLFAFHGKINQRFRGNEEGDLHIDVLHPTNGVWAYENRNKAVLEGESIILENFLDHN